MSKIKIFKLVNGVLELDKEEITLYKHFRKLIQRDKGSFGDSDGRKKLQAFKELRYLYFVCDPDAYPRQHGLNAKETHDFAKAEAELPDNYLPDNDVLAAMDQYIELTTDVATELVTEIKVVLRNNIKVVRILGEKVQNQLDNMSGKTTLEEKDFAQLYETQKQILAMATAIPDAINKLNVAEAILVKEEQSGKKRYGGGIIEDSYLPETSL